MKTRFLLIAFLIALTISLMACDADAPTSPEAPGITTSASSVTTTTAAGGETVTTTVTTTTGNGIIELPPVGVR